MSSCPDEDTTIVAPSSLVGMARGFEEDLGVLIDEAMVRRTRALKRAVRGVGAALPLLYHVVEKLEHKLRTIKFAGEQMARAWEAACYIGLLLDVSLVWDGRDYPTYGLSGVRRGKRGKSVTVNVHPDWGDWGGRGYTTITINGTNFSKGIDPHNGQIPVETIEAIAEMFRVQLRPENTPPYTHEALSATVKDWPGTGKAALGLRQQGDGLRTNVLCGYRSGARYNHVLEPAEAPAWQRLYLSHRQQAFRANPQGFLPGGFIGKRFCILKCPRTIIE